MSMRNLNTGAAKSSIRSVSKSAMPDGKVKGMKSNNGIENAVSAIEGKERSEAILEVMYAFEEQHAQEFAQRELDEDLRWWQRMGQRTMIENMAGLGAGLEGLFGKNNQNQGGSGGTHGLKQDGTHLLSENEVDEEGQEKKINGQVIEARTLQQGEQFAQNTNNEVEMNWQENSEHAMDATDPEGLFS